MLSKNGYCDISRSPNRAAKVGSLTDESYICLSIRTNMRHKKRPGAQHLTFGDRQYPAGQDLFAKKSGVVSAGSFKTVTDLHPRMSLECTPSLGVQK